MPLTRRFQTRLDDELYERLETAARTERRTTSALVRIIIEAWLDTNRF